MNPENLSVLGKRLCEYARKQAGNRCADIGLKVDDCSWHPDKLQLKIQLQGSIKRTVKLTKSDMKVPVEVPSTREIVINFTQGEIEGKTGLEGTDWTGEFPSVPYEDKINKEIDEFVARELLKRRKEDQEGR